MMALGSLQGGSGAVVIAWPWDTKTWQQVCSVRRTPDSPHAIEVRTYLSIYLSIYQSIYLYVCICLSILRTVPSSSCPTQDSRPGLASSALCCLHPGAKVRANIKSISNRCNLFEVAFVWKLTKASIQLPLCCLQGGSEARHASSPPSKELAFRQTMAPNPCQLLQLNSL